MDTNFAKTWYLHIVCSTFKLQYGDGDDDSGCELFLTEDLFWSTATGALIVYYITDYKMSDESGKV